MRRSRWILGALACAAASSLLPAGSSADVGVLIPWSVSTQPDPNTLALRSMDVHVVIEDLHAEVRIDQVFENKTARNLEGKYVMPLGERAAITEFGLWEGESRHTGAIISKQRGRQLYEELTRENIDPGLGETGDEEEAGLFSIRVSPIPAYGSSRIQIAYEEELELASLGTRFTLPLKPRRYKAQTVAALNLTIEVRSVSPIAEAKLAPAGWWTKQQPAPGGSGFKVKYSGKNVSLGEDVAIEWTLAPPAGGMSGRVLSYRDTRPRKDRSPFGGATYVDESGFFLARAVIGTSGTGAGAGAGAEAGGGKDVVVVLDTSTSMQWDKLDGAMVALDKLFAERMTAEDRFSLVTFNDEVKSWSAELVPATGEKIAEALKFVRQGTLAGGSDLAGALGVASAILGKAPRTDADRMIVLLTDGHPTWGELEYKTIVAAAPKDVRLFALGIGDDANGTLLATLASRSSGAYTQLAEAGDPEFALRAFYDKLGKAAYGVTLRLPDAAKISHVYPAQGGTAWDGSSVTFFGRYDVPAPKATATIAAKGEDGKEIGATVPAPLAEHDEERMYVARGWAAARIRDLLDKIRMDGEREEWVNEIVALSKRFMLVTPYTSFLAAPRAVLRPRNFQAGDPLLRVKTGPDIVGVTAMFPFGLTKSLDYVPDEDVWETRFLAPVWMTDGSYECTLVLTDVAGRRLREVKSFVVDSRPPEVTIELAAGAVRPGDTLAITARADADTRTIRARLGDGPAAAIRWSDAAKASIGELTVPADLPPGRHEVHVVAEDFAHNTTHVTATITVLGN